MRKSVILLFSLLLTYSCYCQQGTIKKQDTYMPLPVGSELLLEAVKMDGILELYGEDEIIIYDYNNILLLDSVSELPVINEIECIKIREQEDSAYRYCYCEDNKKFMGNFHFRLPDYQGFQVYYSTNKGYNTKTETCGNLILVDIKTGNAKLINVFFEGSGDMSADLRYFVIDENYNIILFSISCYYEEACSCAKSYLITINHNQEISISDYDINPNIQYDTNPIYTVIPFGPKSLAYFIETNQKKIEFTVPANQNLTYQDRPKNYKLLYATWNYYLNLHLSYMKKAKYLPEVKTYQYVNLIEDKVVKQETGIDYGYFVKNNISDNAGITVIRILDIQGFEVYYSTIGNGLECSPYSIMNSENCCDLSDFNCNLEGYLNFYDRKKQHSIILPVYELNPDADCGFSFRFFYVSKDNTIHIFEGCSSTCYRSEDDVDCAKHVYLSKTCEIKITKDKEFIINKIVANN